MRLGVHLLFRDAWTGICSIFKGARSAVGGVRKRKLSDATVVDTGKPTGDAREKDADEKDAGSTMSGDECV